MAKFNYQKYADELATRKRATGLSLLPTDNSMGSLLGNMQSPDAPPSVIGASLSPQQEPKDNGNLALANPYNVKPAVTAGLSNPTAVVQKPQAADRFAVTDRGLSPTPIAPTDTPDFGLPTSQLPKLTKDMVAPNSFGGQFDPQGGGTDYLGGLVNYSPKDGQTDSDTLQIAGSMFKDIANSLKGGSSDNVGATVSGLDRASATQRGQDALTKVQQQLMSANGDPNAMRAALVQAAMAGVDTSGLTAAMKYGKPDYKGFGQDQNVYQFGDDGQPTGQLQHGAEKVITHGNVQSTDNGRTWHPIPGYRTGNGKAAAAAGSMNVPATHLNPASMYRGL